MFNIIIHAISLIGLGIGSGTDIDRREVPDWLNFSLIFFGLGSRLIYSIIIWSYEPILSGVLGFGIFLGLAYLMFYTGQWGGGDSKMLMGLGALIGLEFSLNSFLIAFFISTLIMGSIYGIIWTVIISIKNRKKFSKEIKSIILKPHVVKTKRWVAVFSVIVFIVGLSLGLDLIGLALMFLGLATISTFYLWIYIKTVEKTCMQKYITPDKLVEGDWIVNDVVVDKKRICGPKDLGISMEQIKTLKTLAKENKIKTVLIKEGIPFVPSFLMAYILVLILGNPLGFLFWF